MPRYRIYSSAQVRLMMYVVTVLPPLAQNNPLSFNMVYNEHTPEHVINSSNKKIMAVICFCSSVCMYM